jgi:hypothetical protein
MSSILLTGMEYLDHLDLLNTLDRKESTHIAATTVRTLA